MQLPGAEFPPAARAFAWGGATTFVASLAYFLYSYDVRFARAVESADLAAGLAWNVALFSVFALHHSVFAREAVRAVVRRTFGDLERSFYVWVASVLFMMTCLLWCELPGVVWKVGGPSAWVFRGLQLAGAWLCVRSAAIIDVWQLAGLRASGLAIQGSSADPVFKTEGPYGWVRHPIYLGWFVVVFSVPTMTGTQFVFAVVSCAYVLIAIPLEEQTLRHSSHGAYDRYMHQVRRKLVPFVY